MNITIYFGIIILILFFIEIYLIIQEKNKSIRNSILSIGIFGTFLGIYLGLSYFNASPDKIDQSVIALIDSLKIAFITSLFGMGASIILSLFAQYYAKSDIIEDNDNEVIRQLQFLEKIESYLTENKENQQIKKIELLLVKLIQFSNQINIQPIVDELQNINGKIVNTKSVYDLVDTLNTNVIAMGEEISTSLKNNSNVFEKQINQVSKTFNLKIEELSIYITDVGKHFNLHIVELMTNIESLFTKFDITLNTSLDNLSEKSTNEITKALGYSLTEFNQTLFEGFGENFKALNLASEKMLVWQENYKSTIEKTDKNLEKSVLAIANFEKFLSQHQEVFEIYQKLEIIIQTFDNQAQVISGSLKNYKEIGQAAKESTPEIKDFLKLLQQNIQKFELTITTLTEGFANEYQVYIQALEQLLKSATRK